MPTIKYLSWDSDFFEKQIGRCDTTSEDDLASLSVSLNEAKDQGYKLIYLFTPENTTITQSIYNEFDTKLIDTRFIYNRLIDDSVAYRNPNIYPLQASDDLTKIYELADECGQYSRFNIDKNFLEGAYKKLYRQWMEKSISGEIADNVFVYKLDSEIVGVITLKISDGVGIPGIMATDSKQRGKGIGASYFKFMLNYLLEQKVSKVEFITQKSNRLACRIYDKMNCEISSATDIYHVWL